MTNTSVVIRPATGADIPGIWEARHAVAEADGRILGFAISLCSGTLWALFVRAEAECRRIGSRLHDVLMAWFAEQPARLLWLSTGTATRARRFCDAVLAPLGYTRVWSDLRPGGLRKAVDYGADGSGDGLAIKQVSEPNPRLPGFHLARSAPTPAAVAVSQRNHSTLHALRRYRTAASRTRACVGEITD